MFQFRRFPSYSYFIHYRIPCGGFPHSEISGSKLICSSPKLFAAYHVLHRLLMPRHSPCALISLTSRSYYIDSPNLVLYYSRIMQAQFQKFTFRLAKIVLFTLLKIIYPLLLPSHNCIIITMFSFQGTFLSSLKKLNEASLSRNFSQFL